jgi:multiple sugar transport system substrate-binding protein
LSTLEGVTRVSEIYYNDTGKAFFGRDSLANMFIIASKEFGIDIFDPQDGGAVINADEAVMRKVWDNYYIPYLSGYVSAYGKFRSDDVRVGDILAYVGSTSSSAYFPKEVTAGGETYPIRAKVLPMPHYEGGSDVIVQQGAGMVVAKSTPAEEYGSVMFLKWFTEMNNNIEFSALSGYMPVRKSAMDAETYNSTLETAGLEVDAVTSVVRDVVFEAAQTSELYTTKPFKNAAAARTVLDTHLHDKAVKDRAAAEKAMENGTSREEAVAAFNTEENFQSWLGDLRAALNEAAGL